MGQYDHLFKGLK